MNLLKYFIHSVTHACSNSKMLVFFGTRNNNPLKIAPGGFPVTVFFTCLGWKLHCVFLSFSFDFLRNELHRKMNFLEMN